MLDGESVSQTRRGIAGLMLVRIFAVFLGVLVALGADRWVQGLDERTLRQTYLTSLQSDLRRDSLQFALGESFALNNFRHVGLLLSVLREGPSPTTDRGDVLAALEELSKWYPRKYAAGTWTDLLATGNLRLIDRDFRRRLSAYYDNRPGQVETDKRMAPFRRYDSVISGLLSPEQRMMALTIRFSDPDTDPDTVSSVWEANDLPDPGLEVSTATTLSDRPFDALIDRLEATPDLEAILGDILWTSRYLRTAYSFKQSAAIELLADPLVAGAAP